MTNKLSSRQAVALGAQLKAARERLGQTLQAVSHHSGVNYTQLSRFERGDFRTRSKNLQKICKILQISIAADVRPEAPHLGLAERAMQIAAQSSRNQRVLEAVLSALDDSHTNH